MFSVHLTGAGKHWEGFQWEPNIGCSFHMPFSAGSYLPWGTLHGFHGTFFRSSTLYAEGPGSIHSLLTPKTPVASGHLRG